VKRQISVRGAIMIGGQRIQVGSGVLDAEPQLGRASRSSRPVVHGQLTCALFRTQELIETIPALARVGDGRFSDEHRHDSDIRKHGLVRAEARCWISPPMVWPPISEHWDYLAVVR